MAVLLEKASASAMVPCAYEDCRASNLNLVSSIGFDLAFAVSTSAMTSSRASPMRSPRQRSTSCTEAYRMPSGSTYVTRYNCRDATCETSQLQPGKARAVELSNIPNFERKRWTASSFLVLESVLASCLALAIISAFSCLRTSYLATSSSTLRPRSCASKRIAARTESTLLCLRSGPLKRVYDLPAFGPLRYRFSMHFHPAGRPSGAGNSLPAFGQTSSVMVCSRSVPPPNQRLLTRRG
mmetsp:Transcript_110433/g.276442  ORF Transcript_110433/g.276442 Transcript_110433/m.276442 type:complete len:239 (-) Transcript_110433:66-782(-)